MRAISLWQPWATGIATGVKLIETRHWTTTHRGEIAIHAAKRWDADQRAFAEEERRLGMIGFGLPFGAIIAIAMLADVKRTEQVLDWLSPQEERWGNYAPRRYGWIFRDVRALAEPVPCVGRQSLWTLDEAIAAKVRDHQTPAAIAGVAGEGWTARPSSASPSHAAGDYAPPPGGTGAAGGNFPLFPPAADSRANALSDRHSVGTRTPSVGEFR